MKSLIWVLCCDVIFLFRNLQCYEVRQHLYPVSSIFVVHTKDYSFPWVCDLVSWMHRCFALELIACMSTYTPPCCFIPFASVAWGRWRQEAWRTSCMKVVFCIFSMSVIIPVPKTIKGTGWTCKGHTCWTWTCWIFHWGFSGLHTSRSPDVSGKYLVEVSGRH